MGCILFFLGSLSSGFGSTYVAILLGRLFIGFGSGIAVVVAPIYLVEGSSHENRGAILNFNQVAVALGSVIAYATCYFLGFSGNWRAMFSIGAIFAVIQFAGLFSLPETLSLEQRRKKLLGSSWKRVFELSQRYRLALVFSLAIFQAFSGSGAIFFFSPPEKPSFRNREIKAGSIFSFSIRFLPIKVEA